MILYFKNKSSWTKSNPLKINMKFYSTNKKSEPVSFKEAVLKGIADDGGLFMPETIPSLPKEFWKNVKIII